MGVSTKPALEDWPLTAILDLFVHRAATALNDGFARDLVRQLAGALIHKMLLWGDRSTSTNPKAYVEAVLEGIGFPCRSGQQKSSRPLLSMSGPAEQLEILRKIAATLAVQDVDDAGADLAVVGAQVLVGPKSTPIGRSLVARHPDGSVFEYVDRQGAQS